MRQLSGLNYYDKLEYIIQECLVKAKQNPFEQFIIIAENKQVIEEMFFQHTNHLVNIEIKTWNQYLRELQIEYHLTYKSIIKQHELVYQLYCIFKNNNFTTFHSDNYYPIINTIIPLLKQIELNETIYNINQPKLKDIMTIYNQLKQNDSYLCMESLFDHIEFNHSHKHIYIEADHLYEAKRQNIIKRLSKYNDITLLYTYQNDNRSFNAALRPLCQNSIEIGKSTFLTDNLFLQNINKCQEDKELYTYVSSTAHNEVKRAIYTILQNITDKKLHYRDFIIVYPDIAYKDIINEQLNLRQIPHNIQQVSSCQYDLSYQLILNKIDTFHTQTIKEYANKLLNEEIDTEYKQYLNELNYDLTMTNKEFKEFFINTCQLDHTSINNNEDHINVCSIDDLKASAKKHIFILGMNETILPHSLKDTSLLLDEDIQLLRSHNISTPLTTIEQLGVHYNNILKALQCPYITMTFSYSISSLSNETRLPSSLYNQLNKMYNLKPLPLNKYLPIDDYYLKGGIKKEKEILNNNIQNYINSKNQPLNLSQELLKSLYKNHLSVSQIETYNKCPYLYYIQYGLEIFPKKEDKLLSNELGSLIHYVLSININNNKNINSLIDYYISKHEELYLKIQSSHINQYFINNLKRDLTVTLQVLQNMINTSLFKIFSQEEKVEDQLHDIDFKGFVDRIDIYEHFISIIDYKSSSKDIDLNLAKKGFNIQMLVYLKMIMKKYHKDPGAVLYFNTKKRILSAQTIHDSIDEDEFYSMYKYGGYVIDNSGEVIQAIDPNINSKSQIVNVSYVKSRGEYKGHIITSDILDELLNNIEEHIYELYLQMYNGCIDIAPKDSEDASIHMIVNPCRYCDYKSVCLFDIFYNEYNLVEKEGEENAI